MNRILTAAAGTIAAVAGIVGLWALSSVVAVTVYRNGQMADHRCLSVLPKPTENLPIGVIAVVVVAALAVLLTWCAPAGRRRHIAWPLAVYAVFVAPLLFGAVALAAGSPSAGPPNPYACMNDREGLT